jgi:putative hydrolase of the HAD superfamily
MIRALFFDLDNTLLDRQAAHRRWAEYFVASIYPDVAHDQQSAWVDELDDQDKFGYISRETYADWAINRFPECGFDRQTFLKEYRRDLIPFYRIDTTVLEMLTCLGEQFSMAIVSNGSAYSQRGKLRHTRLNKLFEHVVLSGEIGISKPRSEPFLRGLELLSVEPQEAMYIGDDPVNDILGACRAGLKTCWVKQGRSFPESVDATPDFVIESIVDLPSCLD